MQKIFNDNTHTQVIKSSSGLTLQELNDLGLVGMNTNQIMMQTNMEAFTNPEVINNSIDFMNKYKDFDKYDSFLTTSNYIKSLVLEYPGIENKNIYLANPIVDFDEIKRKFCKECHILLVPPVLYLCTAKSAISS